MPTVAEKLTLPNFLSANILEELELAADAAPAATTITLLNVENLVDESYIVINPSRETGEIRKVDGDPTGQVITLTAAIALQHRNHERVIRLFGNRIRIWRAPNITGYAPEDAAFTVLDSVLIDPDQPYSSYTDPAGGSGFWYKATYYNDADGSETPLAMSEAIRGGGVDHYVTLDDIRYESGVMQTKTLEQSQIAQRRVEAEGEVKGSLAAAGYTIPLQTEAGTPVKPDVVTGITRLLAAGLVLSQNFGTAKPSSAKDGASKAKSARDLILQITSNKLLLLDATGAMLAKPSLIDGFPDDTTKDDGLHVGPRATMSKLF